VGIASFAKRLSGYSMSAAEKGDRQEQAGMGDSAKKQDVDKTTLSLAHSASTWGDRRSAFSFLLFE